MLRLSSSFALAIKSVASTSRPCEVDKCGQTWARSTQLCAVSLRYLTNCAITITSEAVVSNRGKQRSHRRSFDLRPVIYCGREAEALMVRGNLLLLNASGHLERARVPHVKQPRLTDIASGGIDRAACDLAKSLFNPASIPLHQAGRGDEDQEIGNHDGGGKEIERAH